MLQVTAALLHAPGPFLKESRKDSAESLCLETAALRYQTSTSPATTVSAVKSASGVVLPMFLGELRLDHEQSLALLRTVCDDALKQLASILYEMRQTKTVLDMRLDRSIGDLLYKILNLIEPITNCT